MLAVFDDIKQNTFKVVPKTPSWHKKFILRYMSIKINVIKLTFNRC